MNPLKISLRARLVGLVCVASVCAAVDTLLTRAELTHRPADLRLYGQTLLLWASFATLALAPALTLDAWLARRKLRDGSPVRAALRHLFWTASPVLAHALLDPYTEIGGSVGQLSSVRPWLTVAGALAALAVVLWGAGRAFGSRPSASVAMVAFAASCATAAAVSFHEELEPVADATRAEGKPNVLLLVWDTTRAASLELFGYDRATTPELNQLAQSALVFSNARSVANYTLTSHVSLLTGVYPSHHGAKMTRQRFDPRATPSVAAEFRAAGYRTGAFVGTDVLHAGTGVAHGFEVFDDEVDPPVCATRAWSLVHDVQSIVSWKLGIGTNNGLPHWFQDFQRPAGEVLERARAWIEGGDARPWFCMVNLYDVHWPYLPEGSERERWVRDYSGPVDGYSYRADHLPRGYEFAEQDRQHLRELYDAELAQLDAAVARFLGAIDLSRTGVLMTSDHGEAFGEHGIFEHHDLLETQLHVPLIVRPAGGVEPRTSDVATSGIDVAPTLLALAGLAKSARHVGHNLLDELPAARPILVEDRDHGAASDVRVALYAGNWKLVRLGLGAEQRWELYDLAVDELGVVDVSAAHPEVVARMRTELDEFRAKWGADDERDALPGESFDLRGLGALGYVELEPPQDLTLERNDPPH